VGVFRIRNTRCVFNGHKKAAPDFSAAEWQGGLSAWRNFQLGSDVFADLGRIKVNEMTDTVVWNAAKLGPFA
jgi:hypothetical protein